MALVNKGDGFIMMQFGKELPGIPDGRDLAKTDDALKIVSLLEAQSLLARIAAGPPGIPADRLDYLPEPDIFHDIAGHVPMHTDPHFAETLVRFGECAHTAAALVSEIRDPGERVRTLTNIFRAMARFFWFTIEFGLMRSGNGIRVYGSGLLSSFGEIEHAVVSPDVQRYPLQIEWAINQAFEIDHYQPLLFIVDSFDHLYSLVDELERWMKAGKLNHVAPGEPAVNEVDLQSFLEAGPNAPCLPRTMDSRASHQGLRKF